MKKLLKRLLEIELTVDGHTQRRKYALRDQFAPELIYFSNCILRHKDPEPSGIEGLLDVHIVRSLYESAQTGSPVRIKDLHRQRRPDLRQEIHRPPAKRVPKIHAETPSR